MTQFYNCFKSAQFPSSGAKMRVDGIARNTECHHDVVFSFGLAFYGLFVFIVTAN